MVNDQTACICMLRNLLFFIRLRKRRWHLWRSVRFELRSKSFLLPQRREGKDRTGCFKAQSDHTTKFVLLDFRHWSATHNQVSVLTAQRSRLSLLFFTTKPQRERERERERERDARGVLGHEGFQLDISVRPSDFGPLYTSIQSARGWSLSMTEKQNCTEVDGKSFCKVMCALLTNYSKLKVHNFTTLTNFSPAFVWMRSK